MYFCWLLSNAGDQHEYCKSDTDSNQATKKSQNKKNILQTQQDVENNKSATNNFSNDRSENQTVNNQQVSSASIALSNNSNSVSTDANVGKTDNLTSLSQSETATATNENSSESAEAVAETTSTTATTTTNGANFQYNHKSDQAIENSENDSKQTVDTKTEPSLANNESPTSNKIENDKNNKNLSDLV